MPLVNAKKLQNIKMSKKASNPKPPNAKKPLPPPAPPSLFPKYFYIECFKCEKKIKFTNKTPIRRLKNWTFNEIKLKWLCPDCSLY
jgi:hypothetical protein